MKQVHNRSFTYDIPEKDEFILIENPAIEHYFILFEDEYQNLKLKSLLDKIIAALPIALNENTVLVSIKPGQRIKVSELINAKAKNMVCFGLAPSDVCVLSSEISNKLLKISNLQLLLVHKLEHYNDDQSKKILWALLKRMFVLN